MANKLTIEDNIPNEIALQLVYKAVAVSIVKGMPDMQYYWLDGEPYKVNVVVVEAGTYFLVQKDTNDE